MITTQPGALTTALLEGAPEAVVITARLVAGAALRTRLQEQGATTTDSTVRHG